MMTYDIREMPKVLSVYLKLSEYPLLAPRIRERMRQEIFARGMITPERFEQEVRSKAIRTQHEEGLSDPLVQESPAEWAHRVEIVRDHLTDFYFALNLPHSLFEDILRSALASRRPGEEVILSFNPELAPWYLLFAQAEEYEKLPPGKKDKVRHHLQQILSVLIRGMISDQLDFVGIAREYLDIFDLREIYGSRIGRGKIGGKAAGMTLAYKILRQPDPQGPLPLDDHVVIPNTFFLGADVFYDFVAHNDLFAFFDQKYKRREEIEAEYPEIYRRFTTGDFPQGVVDRLAGVLEELGAKPLIVRSSSLLEDSFGKSFAGKYDSFFCPNQGTAEENQIALLDAIRRVYASTLQPDALFYRKQMGLVDYDERMAVMIQEVEGASYGRYFFPTVAGVAFGRNPFRWNRQIRHEDGFMRLVLGMGTRAVDRVANDYPRMVALSHPHLRPEVTAPKIKKYAQHFVDVVDLEDNLFKTLPVAEVIGTDYPSLELLASIDEGDYVRPMQFRTLDIEPRQIVLTFHRLLREERFITLMKAILSKLERAYGRPVDIEFTVEIVPDYPHPDFIVHLLQCRPLSRWRAGPIGGLPQDLPPERVLFTADNLVPEGLVSRIEYVVYVDPVAYQAIPDYPTRHEVARLVGRLNKRLEGHRFILIGPGRWGSSNVELGVKVSYADIYNSAMLIEVAFSDTEGAPEVSYGTHFFQDLVETGIYPLPLYPDEDDTRFDRAFFERSPNVLAHLLPEDAGYARYVRVIDVPAAAGGDLLEVVMSAEEDQAIGYLRNYT